MKCFLGVSCAMIAATAVGCATTNAVGYDDGWVTTSPVAYQFLAPPMLRDAKGMTYRIELNGEVQPKQKVATFDRQGMRAEAEGGGDVQVRIQLGDVEQSPPGAVQVGAWWYPAFTVSVQYDIDITKGDRSLQARRSRYENALTFRGRYKFETRAKAVGALETIRTLGQKGIEERARKSAAVQAAEATEELAAGLFEQRRISLQVPVVRSAAGLDLEPCFTLLAEARNPDQVREALAAYERFGMEHQKDDGSPNKTANYGIACGVAAARLMLRDLRGAWEMSEVASRFEPRGEEIDRIRAVIYQQEKITGERVIPEVDRERMARQERLAGTLQGVFAKPEK